MPRTQWTLELFVGVEFIDNHIGHSDKTIGSYMAARVLPTGQGKL